MKNILKNIWNHFTSWLEVYFWIPASLLSIALMADVARLLTGRPPTGNADFLVDYASRLVLCIFVIALLSVTREATGVWLTKEEQLANKTFAIAQMATKCFFALLFAYLLSH